MPMKGQLPIRPLVADDGGGTIVETWDEILRLTKNMDMIAVGAFATIGLAVSLGFAIAFSLSGESSAIALLGLAGI